MSGTWSITQNTWIQGASGTQLPPEDIILMSQASQKLTDMWEEAICRYPHFFYREARSGKNKRNLVCLEIILLNHFISMHLVIIALWILFN